MKDWTPKQLLAAITSEETLVDVMSHLNEKHPEIAVALLREYVAAVRATERFTFGVVAALDEEIARGGPDAALLELLYGRRAR